MAAAVVTLICWGKISETFGPMEQNELQCLICHRERVKKWICGSKVRDDVVTNKYSEWIDSFTQPGHQHLWVGHTSYHRSHWFGSTSIACGGIATIPGIFEQRAHLGELKSQKLVARFHDLIKTQSLTMDAGERFRELESFTDAVVHDPESLLTD